MILGSEACFWTTVDRNQSPSVYSYVNSFCRMLCLCPLALTGCKGNEVEQVVLPNESVTTFEPAHVRVQGTLDSKRLADVAACADCHEDVAAHWRDSPHGRASFDNPWYRTSVDAFRKERGEEASRFCAGCHDPVLLVSAKIDETIDPNDSDAAAGVTCLVCHGMKDTDPQGNGSYTLSMNEVPFPDPADQKEIAAHRASVAVPLLRQGRMCGSCHRSFVGEEIGNPHHFIGIDDLGSWQASTYGGSLASLVDTDVPTQTCQNCHMKKTQARLGDQGAKEGTITAHRWPASHSALTSQTYDRDRMLGVRESLRGAASIDIAAIAIGSRWRYADTHERIRPKQKLIIDVAIRNQAVGHRFPGGTRDLQDTWVAITVRDALGTTLLQSGEQYAEGAGEDTFTLRSVVLDNDAVPEELHSVHRFSVPAFDRTIAPRDVAIVRYVGRLPTRLPKNRLPLRIEATLNHRKHSLAFQRFVCAEDKTPRSLAFQKTSAQVGKTALDGCAPQKVTEVDRTLTVIGERKIKSKALDADQRRQRADRLFEYGIGLFHDVQERLGNARPVLREAKREYALLKDKKAVGRVAALMASLEAKLARVRPMEKQLRRARAALGNAPALDRIAGNGYASVWKWKKALIAYRRVAESTPNDWQSWLDLAKTHGSLDQNTEALAAAQKGLDLAPMQPELWRSKSLAFQALGKDAEAEAATERWLIYRRPDEQPPLLAACEKRQDACRRDRQPLPQYPLQRPRADSGLTTEANLL